MSELVFQGFWIGFCLVLAGLLFGKFQPPFLGVFAFLLGLAFLIIFAYTSRDVLNTGSPVAEILPGTYKVGFVYRAGSNVSVGIERFKKMPRYAAKETEHLFLYQFPVKDFEGDVLLDAHKLVVYKIMTSEGTFNKYKFGYNIVQLQ